MDLWRRRARDGTIRLWTTREEQDRRVLRGHNDRVMAVAFTPDSKQIYSGSGDGTLRLWDAKTGKELRQKSGLQSTQNIDLSSSGEHVATISIAGKVRVWNTSPAKPPIIVDPENELHGVESSWLVKFSPDGSLFAAAGEEGSAWSVGNNRR